MTLVLWATLAAVVVAFDLLYIANRCEDGR